MKWKVNWKQPYYGVFGVYFGLLTVLKWAYGWELVFLWVGGFLAISMNYVDRLVHVYFTRPEEPLSKAVKKWVANKQFRLVYLAFKFRGHEQKQLALHSLLFLGGFIPMAFYLISSSGSFLAVGMILGLGLQLAYDIFRDINQPVRLKAWLFWQIKRPVSDKEMRAVVIAYLVCWGLMTWLFI